MGVRSIGGSGMGSAMSGMGGGKGMRRPPSPGLSLGGPSGPPPGMGAQMGQMGQMGRMGPPPGMGAQMGQMKNPAPQQDMNALSQQIRAYMGG